MQAADQGVRPAGQAAKDAATATKDKIPEPGQAKKTTEVSTSICKFCICLDPIEVLSSKDNMMRFYDGRPYLGD